MCFILLFWGCNSTKKVPENKFLLTKNTITLNNKQIDKEELYNIIKQQPNRKLAGIRLHLGVYNLIDNEKVLLKKNRKEKKRKGKVKHFTDKGKSVPSRLKNEKITFREKLQTVVGEPPVILDEELTEKSTQQLELYLKNKGYFNCFVKDTTVYQQTKKKAQVYYTIISKTPYVIEKVQFSLADTALIQPIKTATKYTLLKSGDNFDVDVFQKERERFTKAMKNMGYYYFSEEYIYYEIDSINKQNKVDIVVNIKNPTQKINISNTKDSIIEIKHNKYYINKIYINTDYDPKITIKGDTLFYNGIYFTNATHMQYKLDIISQNIFIKQGTLYRLEDVEFTHSRIAALKTFKFINIRLEEVDTNNYFLNCYINLAPSARQSITIETEGTNRSGNLGIAGNLIYNNKNTFKGTEIFEFRIRGGIEAQKTVVGEKNENITLFNTIEIGPEISLYIPTLWLPFKTKKISQIYTPKTSINATYNYQRRPDYTRSIANLAFSYQWKQSKGITHIIYPMDISSIKIDIKQSSFEEKLLAKNNQLLLNSYSDHLITASKYSFIFTNQKLNKDENFIYFRTNVEGAGNMFRGMGHLLNFSTDESNNYTLFGIRFAQYIKWDVDLRYYSIINKYSQMVYRSYFGIGFPFNNLNVLPFEKSFFAGGANGLRAWTARRVGPGGFFDEHTIDQIGDIQLEANMEYRAKLIKIIESAIFMDIGNIWLKSDDETRPNGVFKMNSFYKDFAIGTGIGLRFNFLFFIIRLDWALKLKDPRFLANEKWVIQHVNDRTWKKNYQNEYGGFKYSFSTFNLGIGYPF